MLKSDLWIKRAVHNGIIKDAEDCLTYPVGISKGVSSYGYDVTLSELKIYTGGLIDPVAQSPLDWTDLPKRCDHYWEIPARTFALGSTVESFDLPNNITGLVFPKSTYARCGLICYQTILEAGWAGQLTLEFFNPLDVPIRIWAKGGIAQILFFEGETGQMSYADRKGKYQNQQGITLARVDHVASR